MATKTLTAVEAGQRAREAATRADKLESSLRAGDQRITAKQIADARLEAEHAALLAEGAKANEVRQAAEDLGRAGDELYARFREDVTAAFEDVEKRVAGFLEATGGLLDSLTTYEDRRNGYKKAWNDLFAGNTALRSAVQFKAGNASSGDFGNLGLGQTARKVDPLQLLVALLAEATRGFSAPLGGIDRELKAQLNSGGYANGLQSIRELRKQIDKQKGTK